MGKDARRWTAEHRAEFLKALARTGTVKGACGAIGKSVAGAHYRRQRDPDFAEAWDHVMGRAREAWADARDVVIHVPATGRIDGYRARHDGWTPARQKLFLTTLSQTGCVQDACARAAISGASAYRWRRKSKRFAVSWDRALRKAMPTIEAEAYRRAVEGWDETVIRNGETVTVRRRYSDSLLRLLLTRGNAAGGAAASDPDFDLEVKRRPGEKEAQWLERRAHAAARAAGGYYIKKVTAEETDRVILQRIEAIARHRERQAEAARLAEEAEQEEGEGDDDDDLYYDGPPEDFGDDPVEPETPAGGVPRLSRL